MKKADKKALIEKVIKEWAEENGEEVTPLLTRQLAPQIEKHIAKVEREERFTRVVKNKETGSLVAIYKEVTQGFKYTVVCLTHEAQCVMTNNRKDALILRNDPTNFCEGCTGVSDIPATPDEEIRNFLNK